MIAHIVPQLDAKKMAEFRACRPSFERMLHMRARGFAPITGESGNPLTTFRIFPDRHSDRDAAQLLININEFDPKSTRLHKRFRFGVFCPGTRAGRRRPSR
ncbi:hypothetical protein [Rhodopila globiformis]|uniref:hypothetical protein n=1 Tax=Rhodopila globiformis TaxID=1071 RepID=UPI0011B07482|nr:hypothetical protein [Rhodopila globiformis]